MGVRGVTARLRKWLPRVMTAVGVKRGAWRVTLVGDRAMAALHRRAMGIGGTTDVLSFDLAEARSRHGVRARRGGGNGAAVDLETVICVDVARREAARRGHGVFEEILLYAVHSLLHVCGYDDAGEAEARRMHRREDAILVGLGVGRVFARARPVRPGRRPGDAGPGGASRGRSGEFSVGLGRSHRDGGVAAVFDVVVCVPEDVAGIVGGPTGALRAPAALEEILSARNDLALSSSALRLVASTVVIVAVAFYVLLRGEAGAGAGEAGGSHAGRLWWVFVLTFLVTMPALLIFSVAIPQAWARYAGESLIAMTWPAIRVAHWVLYPLVGVMKLFDELIRRLAGVSLGDDPETEQEQAEQEIMAVVSEGTAEGTVDEEQRKMIEGVISFRDLQVGQIMTPRTEVVALEVGADLSAVREKIMAEGLSRVPVYEGSLDNIVGILYAKDLLASLGGDGGRTFSLRKTMRPALFVPRTKPLRDLLREFRLQQVHLAVVLDEYGGTSGLVTTEDIVEEIVGDIADEYERPEAAEFKRIDARTLEVDARMSLVELNRALGLKLPEDQDYTTIGGFVISTLGTIPGKGERLEHEGLVLTVLESEPRRVKKLRLELPAGEGAAGDEAPAAG